MITQLQRNNSLSERWRRFYTGHLNIGKHITIYGANAMSWAVNIRTKKWGYICFSLPTLENIKRRRLYYYLSPNATPWASTFYLGYDKREKVLSVMRKYRLGHNFKYDSVNNDENYTELRRLNNTL